MPVASDLGVQSRGGAGEANNLFGFHVGGHTLMMMSDDMALVREYVEHRSEEAFGTLVSRHVDLVYSVALRQVRNPHLAEEVAQGVFILLARKAKSLRPKTILAGWLCRTTRYVSAAALRTERRRQTHEFEAHMQSTLNQPDSDAWHQIMPLLEEGLNGLGEKEHDALVLRFFDGKDFKQVGTAMGTGEDAARMRVNRAVEKLRLFFAKRGVALSSTAIGGVVAAHSVQAAPAGLTAAIIATALSGPTITTTALFATTKAVAMTTLQKSVISATIAVLAGTGIYEAQQVSRLRSENQTLITKQEQVSNAYRAASSAVAAKTEEVESLRTKQAELLRLRGEVGMLRTQSNTLAKLREENRQLRSSIYQPAQQAHVAEESIVNPILWQAVTNQPPGVAVPESQWARVKIGASGEIIVNKQQITLTEFAAECERLKQADSAALVYVVGASNHIVSPAQKEAMATLVKAGVPMKAALNESDID